MDMLGELLEKVAPRRDGDIADYINYFFTSVIVTCFALFIFGWEFCGTTIECWFPAYFNSWWCQYGLDYCYVQNTYFIPLSMGPRDNYLETSDSRTIIPHNITERMDKTIPYYQWLPYILAASAMSFYIPIAIWRAMNSSFGLWVNTILVTISETTPVSVDDIDEQMLTMSKYIRVCLDTQNAIPRNRISKVWKQSNIAMVYLFCKFLFVVNVCCQFTMLSAMLGFNKYQWGYEILWDMAMGKPWQESHYFPRVTLCDFEVRVLGNLHRHTVQCVLLINMFAEKMFVFLWWWLIFVAIITILSFLHWTWCIVSIHTNYQFIDQFYRKLRQDTREQRALERTRSGRVRPFTKSDSIQLTLDVERFLREDLSRDGIFLLRMISMTSGDICTLLVLKHLWRQYQETHNHPLLSFASNVGEGEPEVSLMKGHELCAKPGSKKIPVVRLDSKMSTASLPSKHKDGSPGEARKPGDNELHIKVPVKITKVGLWDTDLSAYNALDQPYDRHSSDDTDSDGGGGQEAAGAAAVTDASPPETRRLKPRPRKSSFNMNSGPSSYRSSGKIGSRRYR